MLITIAAVLAILWLLGFIGNIGGSMIHLVLVIAVALFLYDMLMARRHTV